MGVSMAEFNAAASKVLGLGISNPVAYANYQTGQWVIWANSVGPNVGMNQSCGYTYVCKNQPLLGNSLPAKLYCFIFTSLHQRHQHPDDQFGRKSYTAYEAAYPPL